MTDRFDLKDKTDFVTGAANPVDGGDSIMA
jgi:hypothetical protein